MFERHRPVLRRQASRLLYASGHDSDDVLQDVFLRVHTALRGGVVPLEPRAWLLRLVHNACVDELRRGRTRAVGDVELDGMPALAAQLPDELARRAEARALIGDIHRLPERQRHVLVMSALDGLSHEEVAGRLDTTVETTRSLLARARENLRRTAAARETACQAVCDALDEAAAGGVRASEVARRHLWSCADCRTYQRDLRAAPRRLRRLAAWSPWGLVAQLLGGGGAATVQKVAVGTCCAIVGVGGAVAVPEIAVHSRHLPEITASVPVPVAPEPATRPQRGKRTANTPVPAAPAPAVAPSRTVLARAAVPKATRAKQQRAAKPQRTRVARASSLLTREESRRMRLIMRTFWQSNPTQAEKQQLYTLLRTFQRQRPGSRARMGTLIKLHKQTSGRKATPPPPKGITPPAKPAPTTPTPPAADAPPPPRPSPSRPRRRRPRRSRPGGDPDGHRDPDARAPVRQGRASSTSRRPSGRDRRRRLHVNVGPGSGPRTARSAAASAPSRPPRPCAASPRSPRARSRRGSGPRPRAPSRSSRACARRSP